MCPTRLPSTGYRHESGERAPLTAEHRKTTELAGAATDRAGQEILFERVVDRIHRYFFHLLRDPEHAEDCVQETLLALHRSLRESTYQAGRSFNTWIFMKAHRVWVDWCRAQERARRLGNGPTPGNALVATEPEPPPGQRLDAEVLLDALKETVGAETYETFLLRYEGQLTLAETADALDCDRRTVSRRLERAHALIDRLLEPKEVEHDS